MIKQSIIITTRQTTLWRADIYVVVFGWAVCLIGVSVTRDWRKKGFRELWILSSGAMVAWVWRIAFGSWHETRCLSGFVYCCGFTGLWRWLRWGSWFTHGRLWELLEMLAEGKEVFLWVLWVLVKEVSVVWSFFFNDDTSGLRFRYGRWSGDHEEVMLGT